jgi:TonB family protein
MRKESGMTSKIARALIVMGVLCDALFGERLIVGLPPDRYPRVARKESIEGTVTLEVQVARNGKVKKIRVLTASNPALLEIALKNMKHAQFYKPAHGQPASETIVFTYEFKLDETVKDDFLDIDRYKNRAVLYGTPVTAFH